MEENKDTIIALATADVAAAIALIRISGEGAIPTVNRFFTKKDLTKSKGYSLHLGNIGTSTQVIDQVLLSVFRAPKSYTGEDMIEISCHGSKFIVEMMISLFLKNGIRYAEAGEFTRRAFLNGKLNLAQAEAVADLIAAENRAAYQLASRQLREGFSKELQKLRTELLDFAVMLELELDFSEEDVVFANREQLKEILQKAEQTIKPLIDSFYWGNALKKGVFVAIIGKPNTGKSTLLNTLLNEERAIVSSIPGTTRDAIEDTMVINGVQFRIIDTAGIRKTDKKIETIGIKKTYEVIEKAQIIICVVDSTDCNPSYIEEKIKELDKYKKQYIIVANKCDLVNRDFSQQKNILSISAKYKKGIDRLKQQIVACVGEDKILPQNYTITNLRHYQALKNVEKSLERLFEGLKNELHTDLLAIEMRNLLHELGEITGNTTHQDILNTIFSKFCIGK